MRKSLVALLFVPVIALPAFMERYQRTWARMAEVEQKIQKKEEVPLCGMCWAYVDILRTGKVRME